MDRISAITTNDAGANFISSGFKVSDVSPVRSVASVYESDPREAWWQIVAIDDREWLIPVEYEMLKYGEIIGATVFLNRIQEVKNRPEGMRSLEELKENNLLGKEGDVPACVYDSLKLYVEADYPSKLTFTVKIVPRPN